MSVDALRGFDMFWIVGATTIVRAFVWIGCNALVIYVGARIVPFRDIASRLVGGDLAAFADASIGTGYGSLLVAVAALLLVILFARFLYQRQIFIRV